jgi:uncharacterized protein (DUF885 family)
VITRILCAYCALAWLGCYCPPRPGPVQHAPPAPVPVAVAKPPPSALAQLLDRYYWAQMDSEPTRGARLGYHQYDGRLPDVSPATLAKDQERLRDTLAALTAIDPGPLSERERLERESALYEIRGDLFVHEQREPFRNPLYYVNALGLTSYISRPYAEVDQRARGALSIARAAPAYLAQAGANLEPNLPRPWLETAHKQVIGMIGFVRDDVHKALPGLDPALDAELTAALAAMAEALQTFADALTARLPTATLHYALGEQVLLRMLSETQGVSVTLEQLERVAQDDLARNSAALEAAARAIDPNRDVSAVVAEVIADKPAIADMVATASAQAVQARAFVLERGLVTIPDQHLAEVRETPPYMRFNIAFLDGSGPFEKKRMPSFYYISPPETSWPEAQRQAYVPDRSSLASITVHELWPGHFLHALHMKKQRSRVLRTFRNYATSEGWAHYCEELMAEHGFAPDQQDKRFAVGQLVMALVRDVRFVSAIGLHARGMTVEQSAALFRERALQDAGNAEQQAARGTFDPMYMSYTLGKLMILKLRADYQAREKAAGRPFVLRDFHDRFLSYGAPPIPVIRREILGPEAGAPL